jgi:F-type H+-transporting ATPase subunit c
MMEDTLLSVVSIVVAGGTVTLGTIAPAIAEGRAVVAALDAIARQPEAASNTTRTLFVGIAMVESTAIYCLVVALILLFANPFLS